MMARPKAGLRLAVAFWLLAAAWLCANIRSGTVSGLITWIEESSKFSHQRRLTLEVAMLLGGEKPAEAVAKADPAPKPAPNESAVQEGPFKKLEVPLARNAGLSATPISSRTYGVNDCDVRDRARAAPPHDPPRRVAVS